ncbi:type II toxin-antitoxin system PemK/MazF family toxin [Candidatus Gracilibacteria bacterium]|nr:type II toxin-antitoxin system PemK/MazF family toxin [Candidatus Gracilibacteria bacterium]
MKEFDKWNSLKKQTDLREKHVFFKERDIFWVRHGENIGFEQNGKGEYFLRPAIILKKFNQNIFWGVPLMTAEKINKKYYFEFASNRGEKSLAILSQIRLFDAKRLSQKIGMINQTDFSSLKAKLVEILDLVNLKQPPMEAAIPKEFVR